MAGEEGWEKDYKLKNPCRGGGEQPSFKDQIFFLKFTGRLIFPPLLLYKKKEREKNVATSSVTAHAQEKTDLTHCFTFPSSLTVSSIPSPDFR